jgi:hypothetical protein
MESDVSLTPENAVYQRASRLLAVRDAVAEAFGGRKTPVTDPEDLKEVVLRVRRALASIPGSYGTIVGGLAVQELGYVRWTEDVDVVVDADHYSELIEHLRANGFTLHGDLTLRKNDTGTILDVLKEGQTLKDSRFPIPHPAELGPNRGFATLYGLIRMKLDTGGRFKDLGDLVELLKRRVTEIDQIKATLPQSLHEEFEKVAAQARREAR